MRKQVAGLIVALWAGGCAAPAQFQIHEESSSISVPPEASVTAELARDRAALQSCFDALGQRAGITTPLGVRLSLVVEPQAVRLFEVRPLDAATIVDGSLDSCLESVVARLRGGKEAAVEVALRVTPRAAAERPAPPAPPAVVASGFHPAE